MVALQPFCQRFVDTSCSNISDSSLLTGAFFFPNSFAHIYSLYDLTRTRASEVMVGRFCHLRTEPGSLFPVFERSEANRPLAVALCLTHRCEIFINLLIQLSARKQIFTKMSNIVDYNLHNSSLKNKFSYFYKE